MLLATAVAAAGADETPTKPKLSAPKAVREGNLFLKGGNPSAALERYKDAKSVEPNAREIAFDEGLAHFALGEYDKAREALNRAAGGANDELSDDAIYSAGAADHAEAIAQSADPKAALPKLESAMQQYQSVLSRRPDHQAARDANYKAASYWRQLKQIQQQPQQQQQKQSGEKQEEENSEQEKQEQSAQEQQQEQQQQEQQQQSASQENQEQSQEQQQQESQEQQASEEQKEQQQAAEAKEQEDNSREQAERQLREMMQAQRDRKKQRREEVRKAPIQPVEKDW